MIRKPERAKKISTPDQRLQKKPMIFCCVGVGLKAAGCPEVKEHDAQHSQAAQAVQGRNAIVVLECQRIWRGWAAAGRAA